MKKQFKIYLAGPDVFRSEEKIKEVSGRLKDLCTAYGHSGHFPLDNLLEADNGDVHSQQFSFKIFRANIQLIDEADVVIANLENFRGPGVDDGTAFEMGYGFARRKIVYGYSATAHLNYKTIYSNFSSGLNDHYKTELETTFPMVENFEGNTANLMLIGAIHDSGGKVFSTFEECVKDLAERY